MQELCLARWCARLGDGRVNVRKGKDWVPRNPTIVDVAQSLSGSVAYVVACGVFRQMELELTWV